MHYSLYNRLTQKSNYKLGFLLLSSLITHTQPTPHSMQQQSLVKLQQPEIPDDFQILRLIQLTYQSKTTTQVQYAQTILNDFLRHDKFVEKLFQFLENQQQLNKTIANPDQFRLGVSILIKRFSYHFSKQFQTPKDMFIEKLFVLLISPLNIKSKEQLGIALQYILNHDRHQMYKPKVFSKLQQILQSLPETHVLQGAISIALAGLNSLIEVQDQSMFIMGILQPLIQNAINILQEIRKNPDEVIYSGACQDLFKLSKRIFDLLQLALSRMVDQQDIVQDKLQEIRKNQGFHLLLFSYLTCYTPNKSIVSPLTHINNVKQMLVEIVYALYRTKPMPLNMFQLFLITFLLESERQVYEQQEEHIVSRVLEILEEYLEHKLYVSEFADHKRQILCCLLTYSLSKPDQFELLEDSPQRFIEIAEDYTQGFRGSTSIKVRAGSFLKVYASHFDQGLRSIMQWIVVIITAKLQENDPNSVSVQIYNQLRQQCTDIGFFKVNSSLHMQTCFNVLCLLYPLIKKRDDMNRIIYAITMTHANGLQKLTQPIEIIRLIRMIGYYPSAIYYDYIRSKMSLGKVYILQGLKAFERILKSAKFPEIFEILSQIFQQMINVIQVSDHIFETIVMNHYQRVLKKNINLFNAFLIKLRDTFIENIQKNQHLAFSCLGFVCAMLIKENEASYRNKIAQYFYSMEQFYQKVLAFYTQKVTENNDPTHFQANNKVLKNIRNYQDKIVQTYSVLVKKETNISDRMIDFAINKLPTLSNYNKNEQIFTMYHRMLLKISPQYDGIPKFYEGFMQHIRNMFAPIIDPSLHNNSSFAQKLQILPNLSYLISQILASWSDIKLSQQDVLWILKVLNSVTEDVRQYLLLIILTYAYSHPVELRTTLSSINAYYETLQYLLSTRYEEGVIRKIFLLAMTKLIEIEQKYIHDIVRQCIKFLKEQFEKNEIKKKPKEQIDPKMRRIIIEAGEYPEEQAMNEESLSSNKRPVTCSVPEFKHPWIPLSEYDQFKIRIWQNSDIVAKLNRKEKSELKEVMNMDWVGKKVRKIVSVKQLKQPVGI